MLLNEEADAKFGFRRFEETGEKLGWLLNFHSVSLGGKVCRGVGCVGDDDLNTGVNSTANTTIYTTSTSTSSNNVSQ